MLQLPAVAICLYVAIGLVFNSTARAQSANPADALAAFSKQDNAGAWIKERNYMRDKQDETWKVRMRTLQSLVDAGEESIPPLLDALKNGDDETRVFAAQTLGYLAPNVPREPLLEAATNDPVDAVRLYAVDALGMQGGKDLADDLKPLLKTEKNRDVKKHIGYALERGNQGLEESVIDDLLNWDADTIDSAEIGKRAPDFTMLTGDGKRVRLSDYRGKKAVVVVFVYGDTWPVCHGQLAQLRQSLEKLRGANAELLAVDPHEQWAAKFMMKDTGLETSDINYPLLIDPSLTVSATYGVAFGMRVHVEVSNRPATFIVDKSGVLQYARLGGNYGDRPKPDEIVERVMKLQE